eukprot:365046-Chlamydomonas_euryale.AAC.6
MTTLACLRLHAHCWRAAEPLSAGAFPHLVLAALLVAAPYPHIAGGRVGAAAVALRGDARAAALLGGVRPAVAAAAAQLCSNGCSNGYQPCVSARAAQLCSNGCSNGYQPRVSARAAQLCSNGCSNGCQLRQRKQQNLGYRVRRFHSATCPPPPLCEVERNEALG